MSPSGGTEQATARIRTRFAEHKDYDRLVLKLPPAATIVPHQDGTVLTLKFTMAGRVIGNAVAGRRILSMSVGQSEATLRLAPNTRVHSWGGSDMLVVDVFDAKVPTTGPLWSSPGGAVEPDRATGSRRGVDPAPKAAEAAAPKQPPAVTSGSKTDLAAPRIKEAVQPSPVDLQTKPTVHAPPPSSVGVDTERSAADTQAGSSHPVSIMLLRDAAAAEPTLLVPFGRDVGAAAFSRGGEGRVVFDVPRSFDLGGLKDDAAFGGVTEQLLADGMQLRLKMGATAELRLARRDDGWAVTLGSSRRSTAPLSPITGHDEKGVTALDAHAAGRIVVVNDELTGGRLLVGTQRVGGQHVGNPHFSAEAAVLPTWQGVVVQPTSDRVLLRTTQAGFELSSIGSPPLAVSWSDQQAGAWPDGRTMTRLFDFPNLPPAALHRLLGQALRDAAGAPKLARFGPRIRVAQAMLAQGLDVEAAAVLQTAEADDPSGHDRACARCLGALASWMSARAGGTASPDIPIGSVDFGDSDEAALWKILLRPNSPDAVQKATVVASTWPLLLSYPPSLRRFMLAPVADILSGGGERKALSAFLAAFPDGALDLARADLLRSQGKIDDCLKLYDQVIAGRDRLARADALERAVSVKLASNRISPTSAAEALNGQIFAWRGDDRELRIRQRVAKLRAQAGLWRSALAMLNETEATFPGSQAAVRAAKSALVAELLKGDNIAKLTALDLAAIADGMSDVLDSDDASFAPALVDKLLALDLAGRAEPILRRFFRMTKDAATKAELGVRLATSMLDEGDPAAALGVLAESDGVELGDGVVSRRTLLRGRLLAQSGKPADALRALGALSSRESLELQAKIMEGQHDWVNAVRVLKPLVSDVDGKAVPGADQGDLILRLARDEAEAGDQAGLHSLRQAQAERFKAGPNAALFAVLTAEPVRSTADLPRSAAEVGLLQSVPNALSRPRPF